MTKQPQIKRLGDADYGAYQTDVSSLDSESIIYSFGVGNDVSWDIDVYRQFGCHVHLFDPDPQAKEWFENNVDPELRKYLHYHQFGLESFDGNITFWGSRIDKVSKSTVKPGLPFKWTFPVLKLETIMHRLGHDHVDIVKMDIEGSEYGVIPQLVQLDVSQVIFELHNRFFSGKRRFIEKCYKNLRLWWALRHWELLVREDDKYTYHR